MGLGAFSVHVLHLLETHLYHTPEIIVSVGAIYETSLKCQDNTIDHWIFGASI